MGKGIWIYEWGKRNAEMLLDILWITKDRTAALWKIHV
jgi:hypothetical protein